MLLEPLFSIIETIKTRIASHGPTLRENETRTRMALIDPVLQALGWDVSDPEMVTPEYSVGNGRADYALLTSTGTPSALVEAKKLDESLASHRMQMLNYANITGIPYAGLTDGNRWEMYTVFDQAPIEQRRILDVSIADEPAHEAALRLLLLWRPSLASGQPVAASEPILVSRSSVNLDLPEQESEIQDDVVNWTALTKVAATSRERPNAVRFPDGETSTVQYWWQVLEKVTEWLVYRERLKGEDCPIPGLRFINSAPVGPNGGSFKQYKQVSDNLYLNVSLRRSSVAIDHSSLLLSHCGISPDSVELRFE